MSLCLLSKVTTGDIMVAIILCEYLILRSSDDS